MKKALRQALKNVAKLVDTHFSLYRVYNEKTGGLHYAWTRKEAMEWLTCYNPKKMGRTEVINFFGNVIAATF